MESVQYLRVLRRGWLWLLAAAVIGASAGVATTAGASAGSTKGRYFAATHTDVALESPQQASLLGQATLVASVGEVPQRVADEMGGLSAAEVAGHVLVRADEKLRVIRYTAFAGEPDTAVRMADAVSSHLRRYLLDQARVQADERRAEVQQRLDALNARLDEIGRSPNGARDVSDGERAALVEEYGIASAELQRVGATVVPSVRLLTLEDAEPIAVDGDAYAAGLRSARADGVADATASRVSEEEASFDETPPNRIVRAGIGGLLGLLLAAAFLLVRDRFNAHVLDRHDAEVAFGLPVIATVPPLRRSQRRGTPVFVREPYSPVAEAFRSLRTSAAALPTVSWARGSERDARPAVYLVTSAAHEDDRSIHVANLAAAFAEAQRTVLVVDCDYRSRGVEQLLGAKPAPGGSDGPMATAVSGVWLAPAQVNGQAVTNPATFLAQQRRIVKAALDRFEVVLLDVAPLSVASDAADLLPVADRVLVVARAGTTGIEAATRSSELLERLAAPVVGVVLGDAADRPGSVLPYRPVRVDPEPPAQPEHEPEPEQGPTLLLDLAGEERREDERRPSRRAERSRFGRAGRRRRA